MRKLEEGDELVGWLGRFSVKLYNITVTLNTELLYTHLNASHLSQSNYESHHHQSNAVWGKLKINNDVLGQSALLFVVKTKYLPLIKSIKPSSFAFENYKKIIMNY